MAESRATVLQGTLDLLILKALSAGELHGLGVSRRIEQITRGTFVVQPGSLFPPMLAGTQRIDTIDEIVAHPALSAIPLNVSEPVLQMDGPVRRVSCC